MSPSIVETRGTQTRTYLYQYDTLGRLLSCQRLDGNQSVIRTWQHFDEHNRVDEAAWQTGTGSYSEEYAYSDEDGSLVTVTGDNSYAQRLTYDSLSRLQRRDILRSGSATHGRNNFGSFVKFRNLSQSV